jgi:dihydroorotate dehydrogenase (NAD+) catalytic subunit
MVRRLEGLPGVIGLELGLPPRLDAQLAIALVRAAAGELPLIVRLPFERSTELALAILAAANGEEGVVAFSLGPPHGALPVPGAGLVHGRLYGPAVYPQALAAVLAMRRAAAPVIASGGVYRPEQVETLLAAGARAVQLDAVLWRGGWPPE